MRYRTLEGARPRWPLGRWLHHGGGLRRAVWGAVLAFLLLSRFSLAAHAESSSPPPAPLTRVLVLHVELGHRSDDRLRGLLIDWLSGRSIPVVPASAIPVDLGACGRLPCLRTLAQRMGAGRVLLARIHESGRRTAVWLFDVGSNQLHQVHADWGAQNLWQSLTQTSESLLRSHIGDSDLGSSDALGARAPRASLPRLRLGLAMGFGALSALSLAIGVGGAAKQGDIGPGVCSSPGWTNTCAYDTRPLFIPMMLVSAVTGIAAVLSIAWPDRRPAPKERAP